VRLLNSGWSSTTYWQNGIILCRNAERVLLTLRQDLNQAGDDRLSLLVFGQDRVRCLINLSDSLETLIGDWLEAQFNVFIPCNHCPFGDEDPHMFPLDVRPLTRISSNQFGFMFAVIVIIILDYNQATNLLHLLPSYLHR
jgi:hypothetical protein